MSNWLNFYPCGYFILNDKEDKNGNKPTKRGKGEQVLFPFHDTEEAWFWFVLAQQARVEGARYTAGLSLTPRPCEPSLPNTTYEPFT